MHNLWIPVVAILLVAGLIFGGQWMADNDRNDQIAARIAERLNAQDDVEIERLLEVNKGYGLCGDAVRADRPALPFYYHTVTEQLALGADAPAYRENCGRHAAR
ncbi:MULTISPECIES: hypothetical protein [Halomonas]|uniref:Uncharacterized protein n=1 Tax=Halomonas halophila TaxID=29573 RepID=A0ABQ0U6C1_9GAMM|nr:MULTISPECIES: hypothetical protein [Halomonas]MDR5890884.1 hypothetical protein [Halomonas salina]WJY07541.1 hypothetical protein QWG60_01195 [Halomonas halophila]GEK73998.1 hypothetical protein HHA04nite_25420 [Halomonas halophila]